MDKRILMIAWEYPPRITGGLGVACKGLATALTKVGNTIDMVLPRLTGLEEEIPGINLIDFKKKRHLLSEEDLLKLAKKVFYFYDTNEISSAYGQYGEKPDVHNSIKKLSKLEMLKRINQDLKIQDDLLSGNYSSRIYHEIEIYADWVALLATKLQFDVIHAHDWMTYRAALAAGRVSNRPVVCHVHSTEFDRSGERVNQYIYDLEREAFHCSTMNITVSDYTRNILLDKYSVPPEKVKTVHNGVEFEYMVHQKEKTARKKVKRKIAPREKIITFVGRITFQKGPDYFVRAAKKVIETIPNVRFIMAGTGDMYYRMIEMAAEMGIGSYFHYTGFLDKAGVSKLYSISDLYIMPSVSEPFGITPLEAMLHNVPVIISKQSGVSEIIHNAIKVDFWDIDQIAEGIIQVIKSPKLHRKLRTDGFVEASNLNWLAPAEKVNNIYENILCQRAGVYS